MKIIDCQKYSCNNWTRYSPDIHQTKDDLVNSCLKGMTQNQNEAANGMLWSKCPKTKFCGARRVRIAACETIAVFNTGAASKAVIMNLWCYPRSPNNESPKEARSCQDTDCCQKSQFEILRSLRKSKGDKSGYQPGAFSLSSKPIDTGVSKKRKRTGKETKNNEQGPKIRFVMPTVEVIGKERRK